MSRSTLEDADKKNGPVYNQEEYNDDDFNENYDHESEKNKIVEYSPKGRFKRFNEELGSGAYKIVYKAYDDETGWEVAWNVIRLNRLPDKERKRISDEITLLKQLKHPNIIHFISAWINRQKEEVIFITEAVTGGSLKRFLKKIKTPRLKVIKTWCREILHGIEYLHNLEPHPIIHRDIKCDNIFINSNKGEIRIGDLGLATFMSHAYADSILGTPEFMAPEMYEEEYGPSVDIYSFGMCVLEIVTNQTPYSECMNPAQIYRKVSKGIKPSSLNLIANEEVKNFITDCLKPKEERPTATELLKHRFLQTSDTELDNQPVALYDIMSLTSKIEEEVSLSRGTEKEVKTQQSLTVETANEEDKSKEMEKDKERDKDGEDPSEEEEKRSDKSKEKSQSPDKKEYEKEYVLKVERTKGSSHAEKVIDEVHLIVTESQEHIKVTHQHPRPELEKVNKSTKESSGEHRPPEESKKEEVSEAPVQKMPSKEIEVAVQKPEERKTQSEKPGMSKPKSTDQLSKLQSQEERRKQKSPHDESTKPNDPRRGQEENQGHSQTREHQGKFYFSSKGIINNLLIIGIKNEGQENQSEHFVEIKREKVSPEKIKRKLLKVIDPQAQSDPHFIQQLSSLFESLVSQNILPSMNVTNYTKTVLNEKQPSPERTGMLNNNVASAYFQPVQFNRFYTKYMGTTPKDYLLYETEEAMNLRHQREILELENIHLTQRRNMWDRRQNLMSTSSNNGHTPNNYHLTTFDTDDFYHKLFHPSEPSYRSEAKKRGGSRGTDFTISSVDSAPMSPTNSSGNNIHSMTNWGDSHMANYRRDEIPGYMDSDGHKLEVGSDMDRHDLILSSDILNTGYSHHGASSQNITVIHNPSFAVSPKGNTNTALLSKHGMSNFANQGGKWTPMKAQSDKTAYNIKVPDKNDNQKDALRRTSIEKNLEHPTPSFPHAYPISQNLSHNALGTYGMQSTQQTPSFKTSTNPTQGVHFQNDPHKAERDASGPTQDPKKEVRYEKLTINTQLTSTPDKAPPTQYDFSNQKSGQQRQPANQPGHSATIKKPTQQPLQIPHNMSQHGHGPSQVGNLESSRSSHAGTSTHHIHPVMPIQPNSATLKPHPDPLAQQQAHITTGTSGGKPSLPHSNSSTATTATTGTNPMAQKLAMNPHTSAGNAGNLSQQKTANHPSIFHSMKNVNNTANNPPSKMAYHSQNSLPDTSNNKVAPSKAISDLSQSTYLKLQSPELMEKIKTHRMKGLLSRHEAHMDIDDVKILQLCLEMLTESDILPNGHFSHYTENILKSFQESIGLPSTGVVDQPVWEKMINALEKKIEKRKTAKEALRQKHYGEIDKEASKAVDPKKQQLKDKQNKEATESMTKIESKLIDLSDLK